MWFGLAYVYTWLWVLFYADDGYYEYVPKRYRLKYRLTAYLAYLKAWMKLYWTSTKRFWRTWQSSWQIKQTYKKTAAQANNCLPLRMNPNGTSQWIFAQEAITAHQASTRMQQEQPLDTDSRALGIDNRATAFISGHLQDFEDDLEPTPQVVKAFGGTTISGVKRGTAIISIEDDDGGIHSIRLTDSYYVPGSKDRLLSPQHMAQCMKQQRRGETECKTTATQVTLTWQNGRYRRTIKLDPRTNVATIRSTPGYTNFMAFCTEAGFDTPQAETDPICLDTNIISDDENDDDAPTTQRVNKPSVRGGEDDQEPTFIDEHLPNTTQRGKNRHINVIEESEFERSEQARTDEAALLEMHYKFNHAPFSKLQEMAKQGATTRRLAYCRVPTCAACMYGKATKRQWRTKQRRDFQRKKATHPGEYVSVDQQKSPNVGFIAQLTGILTKSRYTCSTVFVDWYSGFGYTHIQKGQSAAETMEAKQAFERKCLAHGIKVKHYHADNGIFRAREWQDDCKKQGQGLTFTGVDSHHENGRAEARIRRLQEMTRTILSHAKRKWPHEINVHLWPYAMRTANDSINATPNMADKQKRSPEQLFSGSEVATNPKHWVHFGCPVFVLDQALRGSTKIFNKWRDRASVRIYLGRSPQHSRSVALVLNPETGLVSPQFHVQFDPHFDTVPQLYNKGAKHISKWQVKAGLTEVKPTIMPEPEGATTRQTSQSNSQGPTAVTFNLPEQEGAPQPEGAEQATPTERAPTEQAAGQQGEGSSSETSATQQQATTRRSQRVSKPVERLIQTMTAEIEQGAENAEILAYQSMFPRDDDHQENGMIVNDILAMKAKADPDTLYLHEARRQPDWGKFQEAMELEIDEQVNKGIYSVVKREDVPAGIKILPAVWQLRRKRDVRTSEIKKYKARCNVDGSKMIHGQHYEQTYAPVAGWTAIRLILSLVLLRNWKSVQLDYVLAFPQAPAVRDLYMEIPKAFTLDGVDNPEEYVLKVNRNLYGGKDAGRTWYLYLANKLESELGFTKSEHDDCVFYRGSMIYVLYTDDSIIVGPDQKEIDETVKQMMNVLDITIEGTLTDFLGVNIDRRSDNSIKLSQPRLVDQILQDLKLDQENVNTCETPALSSKLLSRHQDSRPFDNSFNYRSVIGKLHYLVAGSRSEIAYAVHQCARFSQDPKMEHAKAVKHIGRYLKGTKTEGMILEPDASKSLEVYVDADFAGNWDAQLAGKDRSTARSRHGFYITYGGIPIAWKSSLQQEIALSSTESEITGLSYALRETIPIMNLLQEMESKGYPVNGEQTSVHCKVFEDNQGAVEIAKTHKFRPRTKHLNNRLFHFRHYVDKGWITIHPISTLDQPADILTKPLNEPDFKKHRKAMNGW